MQSSDKAAGVNPKAYPLADNRYARADEAPGKGTWCNTSA
jgi:hypothetical protein